MPTPRFFYRVTFILISFGASFVPKPLVADRIGEPVLQFGRFAANQGKSQHVGIKGLIGDDFNVTKSSDQNFLIGLGYYFKGFKSSNVTLLYGINAFYLAPTQVKGIVKQEGLFSNLSYQYSRTNVPVYMGTKSLIRCGNRWDFVADLGIGPNIASSGDFKEKSLDGGVTVPDGKIFSRKNVVVLSATAGLGFRVRILQRLFLGIDYRFFYLGKGMLKKNNDQLQNTLHTGNCNANALFFSITG